MPKVSVVKLCQIQSAKKRNVSSKSRTVEVIFGQCWATVLETIHTHLLRTYTAIFLTPRARPCNDFGCVTAR